MTESDRADPSLGVATPPRWQLVELLAISAFAVGQPLLELLGNNPDFFIGRNATRGQIVMVALVALLVPGIAAWTAVQTTRLLKRSTLTQLAQVATFGAFAGLLFIRVVKLEVGSTGATMLATAALPALALTIAYACFDAAKTFVRIASVGILLFGAVFFTASPSSALLDDISLGASGSTIDNPNDIVVILADEFPLAALMRDGELDVEHFPNIARLASTSTWFDDAVAPAGATTMAVPAIVSGVRVTDPQVAPVASRYPESLFTLLHPVYDANVHEVVTLLCPQLVCDDTARPALEDTTLLRDVFDLYKDMVTWREATVTPGDDLIEAATRDLAAEGEPSGDATSLPHQSDGRTAMLDTFIESLGRPADGPRLDYLHLLLPHSPFTTLHDGRTYEPVRLGRESPFSYTEDTDGSHFAMLLAYEQARAADSMLGAVIDRLEELGRWDDTTFVFLSDHGASFDSAWRLPTDDGAPTLIFVPFFLKVAGQTDGERLAVHAGTIDFLPTIAAHLEVPIPWEVDGIDALGGDGEPLRSSVHPWYPVVFDETVDSDTFIDTAHRGLLRRMGADPDGPGGYFAIGPRRDLIGTSLPQALEPSPVDATVQFREAIEAGASDERAQAVITGSVDGAFDTSPGDIVIALDDTILATSAIYAVDSEWRFSAMIDPGLLPRSPTTLRLALAVDDGFRSIALTDG